MGQESPDWNGKTMGEPDDVVAAIAAALGSGDSAGLKRALGEEEPQDNPEGETA